MINEFVMLENDERFPPWEYDHAGIDAHAQKIQPKESLAGGDGAV